MFRIRCGGRDGSGTALTRQPAYLGPAYRTPDPGAPDPDPDPGPHAPRDHEGFLYL
jgi:hypothetical protein